MTTESVPSHGPRDFSVTLVEKARARAQTQADCSSSPERFMQLYEAALFRLRGGVDLEGRCFSWQSPLEMAAEAEALAAFHLLLSYAHPSLCSCPGCRQRRMERARRSKE